ncbi:MAG: VWA domain-containing protein [Acidobacteriaceae bacterium]|nr:VWA domain-containing protein [Acidobacteriaceae bacterium]
MLKRGTILALGAASMVAAAQQPAAPEQSSAVIRSETRLVLVDTVVTDKKGDYVRDLTMKDFRVWQDNKEQQVKTFSFESDPASPTRNQQHYLVLYFDMSGMKAGDQMYARQTALKFLDANMGPNRLIAVADFTGTLKITQNFTADAERLKQAVNGVKFSTVTVSTEYASLGAPSLGAAADLGTRDALWALRSLAKSLGTVPGRKTVVFLSSGFVIDAELQSELTAVIDACNKANVAVYPIDVRGLVAPMGRVSPGLLDNSQTHFVLASYNPQHGGGSGGSSGGGGGSHPGGGTSGGNTGGGRSGGTGTATGTSTGGRTGTTTLNQNTMGVNNPYNQARSIVPQLPPSPMASQAVLYELASGTGGFVIVNTNDLLGGLQKIEKEQNQYYVLGYTPDEESKDDSCHTIKVKVDRGGTVVRSRSGYCNDKPLDLLAGTSVGKELEARAAGAAGGNVAASMALPFFYTGPNTARVSVALEIPSGALKFEKTKGKFHSEVNVLGIAYTAADNTVAAKFSDTVKLAFDNKKELEEFQSKPMHYDSQFNVASGQYKLKVVFSSGGASFGKTEMPLAIDPYDSKKFGLSGIAFSKEVRRVSDLDVGLDTVLLENKTPLVSSGLELTPSGSNTFSKAGPAAVYVEIYDPLLTEAEKDAPKVGLQMRIVDRKTGDQKLDTGFISMAPHIRPGNAVVPCGLKVPVETLAPGVYRAEFKAIDTAGNASVARTADFTVE